MCLSWNILVVIFIKGVVSLAFSTMSPYPRQESRIDAYNNRILDIHIHKEKSRNL